MATEIKVPNVGESINEVTLSQWLVEEGDYVEVDQEICELESDKATLELPSEVAGTIRFMAKEGEDLEIGAVVAEIDTDAKKPEGSGGKKKKKEEEEKSAKESTKAKDDKGGKEKNEEKAEKEERVTYAKGHASPAAAKLMDEHDLKAAEIDGSGKDGRITKQDVQEAIESKGEKKESKEEEKEEPKEAKEKPERNQDINRKTSSQQMSRLRRTIADRLVAAKNDTAMLTTFNEVNMEPIMIIRSQYKDKFKDEHGVGLGFMSFFTRACVLALQDFPAVNAQLNEKEIIYHDYVDMGIAVSTDRGLVVPVIRNVESLSMADIEKAVIYLATRARDGKLDLDEMTGGTFTITNGGVFGSLLSTPILNAPQSAILGMHKIEERPIAENGQVVIKPMMYVALSYDHQIVDGKESVSFLVRVKEYLEHPERLLSGNDPVKELLEL